MMVRIHELLDQWLVKAADRPFIYLPGSGPASTLSFGDLGRLADVAEASLKASSVRAGDRVLVVAENCPEHAALIIACSRIGAWSCGVNARMSSAEVDAFVRKSDARVIFFTSGVSASAAAHAARWKGQDSGIAGVQCSPVFEHAVAEEGALATDVAAIIFTSGTTGLPKGVMVTHQALLHFARVSATSRALGPDDRSYAFVPMTHIFGMGTVLLASLYAGASLVMRPQFEPDDLLDALAHQGITQLQGPPALFSRLLTHLQAQGIEHPVAAQLRYVYTGAGPLDLTLKQRIEAALGQTLHHGYALSEYAGSLHLTRRGEHRSDTSAGYVVDGAQLQVTNPATGQPVPCGERGELWMRGTGLMPGYFRDPQATAEAMRPGGWYASGDLGILDADGALHVVGRLKEMIIRSGFNVYPAEVETVLNAHPSIQRSAVVGRKEDDGNEEVIAFVEMRPGCQLDGDVLQTLQAYLREQLSPYKRPSRIVAVPELPTSPNGKVLKRVLQEQVATDKPTHQEA
ncbi:MAG: acyl--CoA ligase [Comamonas sp.]|nr:acyl--CoA ligase [Candidatus Comamonas equi]